MHGVALLVDAFLGIRHSDATDNSAESVNSPRSQTVSVPSSITPPHGRKNTAKTFGSLSKGQWKTPSSSQSSIAAPQQMAAISLRPFHPHPNRPRCDSILNLLGPWLFEAARIGSSSTSSTNSAEGEGRPQRPNSMVLDSKTGPTSLPSSIEIPPNLTLENFEAGQAEAIGALCRIFCSKKTGEQILPVYLARFYLALDYGLSLGKTQGHVVSSILLNSVDLFKQDLDGVTMLLPSFLSALEMVLPDKTMKIKAPSNISQVELRRASIQILLAMLSFPLHFGNLTINRVKSKALSDKGPITFQSLRSQMVNMLISALQIEVDSFNTQLLLGGLVLCIQDAAVSEGAEQALQQEKDSSLMSSDSAHALFVRATYLVCHCLISTWKTDFQVSLSALEVLTALARVKLPLQDSLECKRAVKWICDFIVYQCSRPPPSHSRDLHSCIVASFQCVTVWVLEHPELLFDKECLHNILEVLELGISGSKSQPKFTDIPKVKGEKELKPVSIRVHDAAEAFLTCIMEHVGYYPSPSGPESLCSMLDEVSLLQYCNSWSGAELTREDAVKQFKYFLLDNSLVLALLEQNLGNDQDPQPTVTALLRGPFGRYALTMQLRQTPLNKPYHGVNPGRPVGLKDPPKQRRIIPKYFPDTAQPAYTSKADFSMPTLDSIINKSFKEQENLLKMFKSSLESGRDPVELSPDPPADIECKAPRNVEEFQTARLFLSHFKYITADTLNESADEMNPALVKLDVANPDFVSSLNTLDTFCTRTSDAVYVFYVKNGQQDPQGILENVLSRQKVHPAFLEFLLSLGWPVEIDHRLNFVSNSTWKVIRRRSVDGEHVVNDSNHGGSVYDGVKKMLYWADVSSELAFIVPSWKGKLVVPAMTERQRSFVGDDKSSRRRTNPLEPEEVIFVWLENWEDGAKFPACDVFQAAGLMNTSGQFILMIHPLENGLYRIKTQHQSKSQCALPLIDGMIASMRVLGTMARQTVLNYCKRRRLDAENTQLPHVRRRFKIQEMGSKFGLKLKGEELFYSMFE